MSDKNTTNSKIASAVYLITGFFADQEPLKWRLRGLAGDLVSANFHDKGAISRELSNLFGLARAAGLVSDTNHDILVRELARIAEEGANPLALLLETSRPVEAPKVAAQEETQTVPVVAPARTEYLPAVKDNIREFGAVSVKKNGRQSTIVSLLKRKKEIMIKDVTPLIPGCSEKTIQRELSEMVEEGILRKIGDKRWTRYTLA